jgi:hypothetical protein
MVPENVLIALDRLLASPPIDDVSSEKSDVCSFATDGDHPMHVVRGPGYEWFVALFEESLQFRNPASTQPVGADSWLPHLELVADWKKRIESEALDLHVRQSLIQAQVLHRDLREIALCIPCDSVACVASLIQQHGLPPETVAQDWKDQLASLCERLGLASTPSPSTLLTTEDGILVPVHSTIQQWADENQLRPLPNTEPNEPIQPANWPWKQSHSSVATIDWLANSTEHKNSKQKAALAKPLSKRLLSTPSFMFATLVTVVVPLVGFLMWPTNVEKLSDARSSARDQFDEHTPPDSENLGENALEAHSTSEELTTLDDDVSTITNHDSTESSIDRFLADLNPRTERSFSLTSTSPASIIQDTLSGSGKPSGTNDMSLSDRADAMTPLSDSDEGTNVINEVPISESNPVLERSLKLETPATRVQFSVGQRVLPKQCRCQVELVLHKRLVAVPPEPIIIDGMNKATWRIAMEDEEPELMFEVSSKPNTRWQIVACVGLQEYAGATPVLVSPQDTKMVGNRFIEYHQWLGNSVVSLQNARLNRRTKTRIDYFSEIRKCERQQREVEKAMAKWKVVEKLCYLFFDSHEVRLKLIADVRE